MIVVTIMMVLIDGWTLYYAAGLLMRVMQKNNGKNDSATCDWLMMYVEDGDDWWLLTIGGDILWLSY